MVERDDFIQAMRGVAHSVTVVTTQGEAGHNGATVSAFCSVSADPPTVLVCLNAASKIAELVTKNQTFTVTVLPDDAQHYADRFAGRHDAMIEDRFSNMSLENGAPFVEGAAVFECDLDNAAVSGSHHIVVGRVRHCKSGDARPLTYLDGAYHYVSRFPEAAE